MPQSKKRHHHHLHHQQSHPANSSGSYHAANKPNRLLKGGIIFFAVLGFLLCYFITEQNIAWMITGTFIGGIAGYFFARQMGKTFSK